MILPQLSPPAKTRALQLCLPVLLNALATALWPDSPLIYEFPVLAQMGGGCASRSLINQSKGAVVWRCYARVSTTWHKGWLAEGPMHGGMSPMCVTQASMDVASLDLGMTSCACRKENASGNA